MAFAMEFVSNFIKRAIMEDPVARREKRNAHLADVSARAAALCVPSPLCFAVSTRLRRGRGAGAARRRLALAGAAEASLLRPRWV